MNLVVAGLDVGRVTAVVLISCNGKDLVFEEAVRVEVQDMDSHFQMAVAAAEAARAASAADIVAVESGVSSRPVSRFAVWSHEMRGAFLAVMAACWPEVRVVRIAPARVKKLVAGSGRATKAEVRDSVFWLFGHRADEHVSDAAAVAIACARGG
jgi:Holliday junction resolvasome RuvABC endonuclease subunit